jgi:CxxC motif-containing protein (DUF1111 family)
MKKFIFFAAICLVAATVQADDATEPADKILHDGNCLSCHKPDIYTRAERRVTSKEKLSTQVRMCVQQLQLTWFDEETESVTEYLNREFYNFE